MYFLYDISKTQAYQGRHKIILKLPHTKYLQYILVKFFKNLFSIL